MNTANGKWQTHEENEVWSFKLKSVVYLGVRGSDKVWFKFLIQKLWDQISRGPMSLNSTGQISFTEFHLDKPKYHKNSFKNRWLKLVKWTFQNWGVACKRHASGQGETPDGDAFHEQICENEIQV